MNAIKRYILCSAVLTSLAGVSVYADVITNCNGVFTLTQMLDGRINLCVKGKNILLEKDDEMAKEFVALSILASTKFVREDRRDTVYLGPGLDNKFCTETDCFFPGEKVEDKNIHIIDQIDWENDKNLILHTKGNITFEKNGKIISKKNGSVILKTGMEPDDNDLNKQITNKRGYSSTIIFEGNDNQIILGNGKNHVELYYNPEIGSSGERHKYHNPTSFGYHVPSQKVIQYMLVNDVYDLQGITALLHGNFALSQNINAKPTHGWRDQEDGEVRGFYPIMGAFNTDKRPFSGIFDGQGYTIDGLFINRPDEPNVGLFGDVTGMNEYKSTIKNFVLRNSNITGKRCVGGVVGQATGIVLKDINVLEQCNKIFSVFEDKHIENNTKGLIAGCVFYGIHTNVTREYDSSGVNKDDEMLFGSCVFCNDDTDDD